MALGNRLWLAHCCPPHKGHHHPPKVLQQAYGGRLDLFTFRRGSTRKTNVLTAWEASLKRGGSCGVCQRAVASSPSSTSQRSHCPRAKLQYWSLQLYSLWMDLGYQKMACSSTVWVCVCVFVCVGGQSDRCRTAIVMDLMPTGLQCLLVGGIDYW